MNRREFFFVYANASSIAELGLQRAAERAIARLGDEMIASSPFADTDRSRADDADALEADAADADAADMDAANAGAANAGAGNADAADANPAETEADMFAGLDLSALDGVWSDGFGTPGLSFDGEPLSSSEVRGTDADWWSNPPADAMRGSDGHGSSNPPMDESVELNADHPHALAQYLDRAYAAEDSLRDRIDRHAARVDGAAIERLLIQLSPRLAPLTGRLSVDELEAWLADYDAGDVALNELVMTIRRLDLDEN